MTTTYIKGDVHDVIKTIPDNYFNFIYFNPPFGTTNQKWDKPLDWKNLFPQLWRILKDDGVIAIHTGMPFTYDLIAIEKPKYHYTWQKNNPTGFFNAKKQPLRDTEEILIYYKNKHTYNPQMIGDKKMTNNRQNKYEAGYYGNQKPNKSNHIGKYPRTYIGSFKRLLKKGGKSIQDDIIKKMINTYSNPNDYILDCTHHNQIVGNIAKELNRNYTGIDINPIFLP